MFNDPNDSSFPELDGKYVLRCDRIEDADPGQFGPRVRWVFSLWDFATQAPVTWDNGEPFEWFQLTSTKTGNKSVARKWMQALLGREITPDDSGAALAQAVVGKYAEVMIAENDAGYPHIVSIKPYSPKAGKKAAPAPAPEPEPVAVGAAAGGTANPFDNADSDEDSPF